MKTSATSLIAIMNLAVAAAKEVRHLRKLQPMSMEFSSTKEPVPGGMNVISSEDGKSAEIIQQQTSTKPDVGDLIFNDKTKVEDLEVLIKNAVEASSDDDIEHVLAMHGALWHGSPKELKCKIIEKIASLPAFKGKLADLLEHLGCTPTCESSYEPGSVRVGGACLCDADCCKFIGFCNSELLLCSKSFLHLTFYLHYCIFGIILTVLSGTGLGSTYCTDTNFCFCRGQNDFDNMTPDGGCCGVGGNCQSEKCARGTLSAVCVP